MKEFFKKILLGKRYSKPEPIQEEGLRRVGFSLYLKTGETIDSGILVKQSDVAKTFKSYENKLRRLKQNMERETSEYVYWQDVIFLKKDFKNCIVVNNPPN